MKFVKSTAYTLMVPFIKEIHTTVLKNSKFASDVLYLMYGLLIINKNYKVYTYFRNELRQQIFSSVSSDANETPDAYKIRSIC